MNAVKSRIGSYIQFSIKAKLLFIYSGNELGELGELDDVSFERLKLGDMSFRMQEIG